MKKPIFTRSERRSNPMLLALGKWLKLSGGIMKLEYLSPLLILLLLFYGCNNKKADNSYTGILEGTSIQVPAMTPGKIVKFIAETGNEVQEGDTIAVIDSTELCLQLKQIMAGLKEIRIQNEIANTALKKTDSDFSYIKEKETRVENLVNTQSLPQQSLDDISNLVSTANSARKTAQRSLEGIEAKVEQLCAQKETIQKKIKDCVILAPESGIIFNKYFERGEAVPPLTPVVEIIQIKTVEVKIYVSESTLPGLKFGQKVQISVDGITDKFPGEIIWISPKAEFTPKTILTPETRTSLVYAVKIRIQNPQGVLKHGMPVVVMF